MQISIVAMVQEVYVHGVSTRSMDELVKAMASVSKSQVSRLYAEIDERVAPFWSDRSRAFGRICGWMRPT